jgi:hypothetical protein
LPVHKIDAIAKGLKGLREDDAANWGKHGNISCISPFQQACFSVYDIAAAIAAAERDIIQESA